MKRILLFFLTTVLLSSCFSEPQELGSVEGLKPIYLAESENITAITAAVPFLNLGKIVYAEPYILINEQYKGIHLIDNTNPEDPQKINFVQIPGNTDFTVREGYLYANSGVDLVTYRFENALSQTADLAFEEVHVIEEFFGVRPDTRVPPNYSGFFECVNPEAGVVVGWESTIIDDPECRT